MYNVIRSIVTKNDRIFKAFWEATQNHWDVINSGEVPTVQDLNEELLRGYIPYRIYTSRQGLDMPGREQFSERMDEIESFHPEKYELVKSIVTQASRHLLRRRSTYYRPENWLSTYFGIEGNFVRVYVYQTEAKLDFKSKNIGATLPAKFIDSVDMTVRFLREGGNKHSLYEIKAGVTPNPFLVEEFAAETSGDLTVYADLDDGMYKEKRYTVSQNLYISPVSKP